MLESAAHKSSSSRLLGQAIRQDLQTLMYDWTTGWTNQTGLIAEDCWALSALIEEIQCFLQVGDQFQSLEQQLASGFISEDLAPRRERLSPKLSSSSDWINTPLNRFSLVDTEASPGLSETAASPFSELPTQIQQKGSFEERFQERTSKSAASKSHLETDTIKNLGDLAKALDLESSSASSWTVASESLPSSLFPGTDSADFKESQSLHPSASPTVASREPHSKLYLTQSTQPQQTPLSQPGTSDTSSSPSSKRLITHSRLGSVTVENLEDLAQKLPPETPPEGSWVAASENPPSSLLSEADIAAFDDPQPLHPSKLSTAASAKSLSKTCLTRSTQLQQTPLSQPGTSDTSSSPPSKGSITESRLESTTFRTLKDLAQKSPLETPPEGYWVAASENPPSSLLSEADNAAFDDTQPLRPSKSSTAASAESLDEPRLTRNIQQFQQITLSQPSLSAKSPSPSSNPTMATAADLTAWELENELEASRNNDLMKLSAPEFQTVAQPSLLRSPVAGLEALKDVFHQESTKSEDSSIGPLKLDWENGTALHPNLPKSWDSPMSREDELSIGQISSHAFSRQSPIEPLPWALDFSNQSYSSIQKSSVVEPLVVATASSDCCNRREFSDIDLDDLMAAIAREIQLEYKRFYGN